MKKILICCLLLCNTWIASAQYVNYESSKSNSASLSSIGYLTAQLGVGVYKIGTNEEIDPTMTSMSLSLTCNTPIYPNMGIEWGIIPKYIWGSKSGKSSNNEWEYSQNHLDLELPVLYNYKYHFTPDFYLRGFAGIFLQFGLSGSWSMEEEINDIEHHSSGNYFEGYKRFDLGIKSGIEIGWEKVSLAWYNNKGFINLYRDLEPEKEKK